MMFSSATRQAIATYRLLTLIRLVGWRVRLTHLMKGVLIERGMRFHGNGRFEALSGVVIQYNASISVSDGALLHIGRGSRIGSDAVISCAEDIWIGDNVLIAARCYISDHGHAFRDPSRPVMHQGKTVPKPVHIGDGSWLGINVCILPGVTLGAHCIVGANSVVNQSFGPGTIVAGAPARAVGSLSPAVASVSAE